MQGSRNKFRSPIPNGAETALIPAHHILNTGSIILGNNNPVELIKFIEAIEDNLGRKAIKEFLDLQPGDVVLTFADVDDLMRDVGFKPQTPLDTGIKLFITWYLEYYGKSAIASGSPKNG